MVPYTDRSVTGSADDVCVTQPNGNDSRGMTNDHEENTCALHFLYPTDGWRRRQNQTPVGASHTPETTRSGPDQRACEDIRPSPATIL